jgi:hypothetical protein
LSRSTKSAPASTISRSCCNESTSTSSGRLGNLALTNLNASNITSGTLSISQGGIGTTTLSANQLLIGNAATLSSFLPLTGGLLSGNLTGTSCSMTSVSANTFSGSGAALTNLNVSNATSGTLSISRGGIGTTTLSSNQILIGNTNTSILQSPNLVWDNTTNTLSASNFIGSGAGLTSLNASNITTGTLTVNGSGLTALNASNILSGTLTVSRGGIGTTSLINNQILLGNGTNAINQTSNLFFDTINNRMGICTTQPNYTLDVSGNINGNNLNLQNLSNPNSTTILINSETS